MILFSVFSSSGFSFSSNNFQSSEYSTEEECLTSLLEYSLSLNNLLIHIKGLSPSICKKIDWAFGKGFSFKFDFANSPLNDFISFALQKSYSKKDFLSKIILLISPFHKISYESPDIIVFQLPNQTNPTVKQFFTSKKFIQSSNWINTFQSGDISFFSDASCEKFSTLAGAAVQNNHFISAFRKKIPLEDNNLSELKAILDTIYLAQAMNLKNLLLYTDNSNAIDFISKTSKINNKNSHFFQVAEQINQLLKSFVSFHIAWIPRKNNFIADNLSKNNFNGLFFER